MKEWSAMKKLIWLKRAVLSAASAILKTVTGLAPLLLGNALARPIHALTQYGECVQDGTPTPDAPVDIMCNNGALKMVDDELPATYKRVLGFSCDNNAMWEITGFKLKGSDTVRVSFSVNAACNVWGCYQGTSATDNYDLYVSTTSGAKYFRYGSGTYQSYWSPDDLGERFDVVYTPNGSQGMPQDSTWSPLTFTSANDLLIGSTTLIGTSAKLKGNIYGNFVVDGRLHLIPCERVSDGVLGYYDTYGATFYEPYEGFDGAVSLGYDGSHYSITADGTPEVLTVIGKNLINPDAAGVVNGSYITNTGNQASDSLSFISDYIPVAEGETYTAQGYRTSGTATANLRVHGFDSAKTWTEMLAKEPMLTDEVTSASFTIPSGVKYVRVCGYIGYRSGKDAMLELGSTATAYEPYTAQTASVENLLAVGNYKDTQEIIDGLLTHKVGAMALDGTEAWQVASTSGCYYAFISTLKYNNPRIAGLSTHFVGSSAANANMPDNAIAYAYSGSNGIIVVKCTACADVTAFRALLSAQYAAGTPVIIIYPLATETTEQTTAQHLHTANGTNIVDVTSNVDPVELKAEYYATE